MMHKISLIFSGILFLLGCITLGTAIFFSDVLPKILEIYMSVNETSSGVFDFTSMSYVNSTHFYILAVVELILGAAGYFFNSKKVE
jgi:hypothetical protein